MGVYDLLKKYLSDLQNDSVQLKFSDIEKLLGRSLPRSAYEYGAWWANGGHLQANAWLEPGYKVVNVDFVSGTVTFSKNGTKEKRVISAPKPLVTTPVKEKERYFVPSHATDTMEVCGYTFTYLQDIVPKCDSDGKVIKYYPQSEYDNKAGLPLLYHGKGAFCKFSIEAGNWPGVYLWVVDGQIIYIGETSDMGRRFNAGYGNVSPRNCYAGGQSTNCKMNKVVLGYYEKGKSISIYFRKTMDYKRVELDLLNTIFTPYNVKDNCP